MEQDDVSSGFAVVAHQVANVAKMENPAEGLGQGIGRIDGARDVFEDDVASLHPFLDSMPLNVKVTRVLGRYTSIGHQDGSLIVAVDGCGLILWKAEVGKDGTEVFSHFGSLDSSNNQLEFGSISDGTATQSKSETSDGAAGRGVHAISSVHVSNKREGQSIHRKRGMRVSRIDGKVRAGR
jgi:hypothetical protein